MNRLFTAVLLLPLLASAACGRGTPAAKPSDEAKEPAGEAHSEEENAIHLSVDMVRDLRISTAPVTARTGAQQVSVLGEVLADQARYAEVALPTGGQIVRVLVDTDARVAEGTALAQVRSTDLGRARADLLSAEARHELARQALDRKRTLAGERIVAQREVQEAEATFRAADAEKRAALAALQALGARPTPESEDSSLFLLRSPIAGRVIERSAVIGQYAEPSMTLFTVADLARVWVVAQAFERDAVNIRVGTIAHITLAALPGQEFDGRVRLVGRQVDHGSRTLPIRIELENPAGVLRPGMSANARLEVAGPTETVLAVPSAALQRVGDRWLAFVPKGPTEYEMRPVGRGRDLGNEVEIISGLRVGENVVVDGAFLLKAEAEKRAGGDEHGH